MGNQIVLKNLKVIAHVGVPEAERNVPQCLLITLTLWTENDWCELNDDIDNTVNYAEIAIVVQQLARKEPRRLIETLAAQIGMTMLDRRLISRVAVEIRKEILPETEYVAVKFEACRPI